LQTSFNHVNRAAFTHPERERHHHLTFAEGCVLGTYMHQLSEKRKLLLGAGYLGTTFHFSHHPRRSSFEQRHFDNLLLQFGLSTKEIDRWDWNAKLGLQINTEHFRLSRYTFFSGLLHGRYDWHENRNLHVGILGYAGMRYTRLLPIVGFDYKYSNKW